MQALPPEELMLRVSGDRDPTKFLLVGAKCFSDIIYIADDFNHPVPSLKSVLDFGCGCGRVLRFWPSIEGQSVHGTDIDGDAIAWCSKALPAFSFGQNNGKPATRYRDQQFDFIYSVSVFSHLRPDYAEAWIDELKRISMPSCLLIVSFHGAHLVEDQSGFNDGLMFQRAEEWSGRFPDWYGNLYLSEDAAARMFGAHFAVLKVYQKAVNEHQDVIVLQA